MVQTDMNTMKAKQTADRINAIRATNGTGHNPNTLSPRGHTHEPVASVSRISNLSNVSLSPQPLHMAASSSINSVSNGSQMGQAPMRPALPSVDTDTNMNGEYNVFLKNQTIPPGTAVEVDMNMMGSLPPRVASVQPVVNMMAATPGGDYDNAESGMDQEDDDETPPPLPPPAPQEIDDMDNEESDEMDVMIDKAITKDDEDMYGMDLRESDDEVEGTNGNRNLVPARPTPGGENMYQE